MTGELFGLLAERSVLRHSVGGDSWEDDAFAEAVTDVVRSPTLLGETLFGVRAEHLLSGADPGPCRGPNHVSPAPLHSTTPGATLSTGTIVTPSQVLSAPTASQIILSLPSPFCKDRTIVSDVNSVAIDDKAVFD